MVSKKQIQRFFAKQCTTKEAEQVAAWLKAHPEEAAAYLEEVEWHNASADKLMPEETYIESWQFIQRKIKSRKRYILLKRSVMAACIVGCIAISIFYYTRNEMVPVAVSYFPAQIPVTKATTVDTEYNLTGKSRRILLADGSVITLSPKSVVWFDTPFALENTRDIYLKGEARFEVAKNRQKPFTVYSGLFSTTALGTEFIVKEQPHSISVKLMHGKVVIKNTDHSVKNWENIYLAPGQQMIYNDHDALAKVSFIHELRMSSADKLHAKRVTQRENSDSLIFNGSPLAIVLQKLHDYYHVNIQFVDEDIKNISFTGVIVKKDSLQTILKVITQMNSLSVESTDSSFTISKEKN
jgi:transmembrane sensor